MRFSRWFTFASLLTLALASGCNRGSRPAQLGERAPDFTVSDGTTSIHLANYRGHVVLLNFWATWCPPCVQEMPSLIELHHEMPNLDIIAISIDEDPDAYKNFINYRHIDLTTVRDPSESTAKLFHTDMWPETYVIDRKGYIRRKFIGAQDWNDPEIRQFLKGL